MMSYEAEDRPDINMVLNECDKWKDITLEEKNKSK